jgi:hypothetical protein
MESQAKSFLKHLKGTRAKHIKQPTRPRKGTRAKHIKQPTRPRKFVIDVHRVL